METSLPKLLNRNIKTKVALQITIPLILFTIITLQLPKNISINISLSPNPIISNDNTSSQTNLDVAALSDHQELTPNTNLDDVTSSGTNVDGAPSNHQQFTSEANQVKCDLFSGEWVPNSEAPYYTNETCRVIQEHQNCMKYGRPDTEFMKYKWKPNGCELPIFNPYQFLNIVKGKSLAFVGDSVARNHMQSLICLLSRVEHPMDISPTKDDNFKRWYYESYNFTMNIFWSPFLVNAQDRDPNGKEGSTFIGLYLDEANEAWATEIDGFDYVIISAGHWFARPLIYYEKRQVIGCRYCEKDNLNVYSFSYAYRNAFKTAFRTLLEKERFGGKVFLRTFAPSHFEGGAWDNGGDCRKIRPIDESEFALKGENLEMYTIQMEEFKEAQKLAQQRGLEFHVLDMTRIMLVRPDGHPSIYGRPANMNAIWPSDCVHWCLPGPIDTWNDFLLEMLSS